MLERVIHRHHVEAAARVRRILNESGLNRNAEQFARMARVVFVGLDPHRGEPEFPKYVDDLAASRSCVEDAIPILYIRGERTIAV